ncbi:hypothetical protein P8452_57745 [Trifolium repens]|nr:hypothetical protein P8452_57745 [Trifolium repens]
MKQFIRNSSGDQSSLSHPRVLLWWKEINVSLNTLEEWHNGGKLAGKAACQKNRSKETLGTPQKNWTHKLRLLWKADPEETVFVGHLFEVFEMCYSGFFPLSASRCFTSLGILLSASLNEIVLVGVMC